MYKHRTQNFRRQMPINTKNCAAYVLKNKIKIPEHFVRHFFVVVVCLFVFLLLFFVCLFFFTTSGSAGTYLKPTKIIISMTCGMSRHSTDTGISFIWRAQLLPLEVKIAWFTVVWAATTPWNYGEGKTKKSIQEDRVKLWRALLRGEYM